MDTSENLKVVLVTSTMPDLLNSNKIIRDYVCEGFKDALPMIKVVQTSFETASEMVRCYRPQLIVAVGGLVHDCVDFYPLRRACDRVLTHLQQQ